MLSGGGPVSERLRVLFSTSGDRRSAFSYNIGFRQFYLSFGWLIKMLLEWSWKNDSIIIMGKKCFLVKKKITFGSVKKFIVLCTVGKSAKGKSL